MFHRHFYRISYVTKAKVMMPGVCFEAMTENLCADGVFIRTDNALSLGKRARLYFNIPNVHHTSVTVHGEVVRCDSKGIAFQFKSLDFETFSELKSAIKQKPLPFW